MIATRAAGTPRRRPGITVIEVLIAVSLFALVIGMTYRLTSSTHQNFTQGTFKYQVQHEGQRIIEQVRRDLLQSCKKNLSDPILRGDATTTWIFDKFTPQFNKGRPIAETITYRYDASKNRLDRQVAGPVQNRTETVSESVVKFDIEPYKLNARIYFRVEFTIAVSAEETRGRKEEVVFITSVESRYENNLYFQAGWNDNPHSMVEGATP